MAIDVRAAILSVYYRAEAAHPTPPPGMPSLEDSAVAIRDDAVHGGHAESRRRRAIARLAAAGVDAHEAVLTTLGAPVDAIRTALANQPGLDESQREMVVSNLLNGAGPAVAGCEVMDPHTGVEVDPTTGIIKATVTLSVKRPMTELAVVMDPQSWVRCSDYFKNTYVARKDGNDYKCDKNYDGFPAPDPPRRGAPWNAVLFEHFELPWGYGVSWFRNFLSIDASPGTGCVKYGLYRSIRSRVGCEAATGIDAGITHDAGYTLAKPGPGGWTSLKAVKEIRFSDRDAYPGLDMNFWARVMLRWMGRRDGRRRLLHGTNLKEGPMSRSSIHALTSAVVLLLLVADVSGEPPARPRSPTRPAAHTTTTRPAPDCPQPPRRELNAAMLSVYYHATAPARRPAPREHGWRPIAIEKAGKILWCDRTFGASGRQRRAIVKLAAQYVALRDLHSPDANAEAAAIRRALDELHIDLDRIIHDVRAGHGTTVKMLEISIQTNLDQMVGAPQRTCCACMDYCDIDSNSSTGMARVRFGISTPRAYPDLARVLDPQAWPTCETLNFPQAYYTGTDCPVGTTTIPSPSTSPPTRGSTWPKGILFENFDSNFEGGSAVFKNLLNITTLMDTTAGSYSMDYGLCAALESQVLDEPLPIKGIGVDEDCGYAHAMDVTSKGGTVLSKVAGLKCIKFSDRGSNDYGLNDLAQFGLEIMADEVVDTGVCCGVEEDPSLSCDCDAEDCATAPKPTELAADPKHCKDVKTCNPPPEP